MVQGLGCSKPRGANPPQQAHASDKFVFLCHAVLKKSFFYDNPLHWCSHFINKCLHMFWLCLNYIFLCTHLYQNWLLHLHILVCDVCITLNIWDIDSEHVCGPMYSFEHYSNMLHSDICIDFTIKTLWFYMLMLIVKCEIHLHNWFYDANIV